MQSLGKVAWSVDTRRPHSRLRPATWRNCRTHSGDGVPAELQEKIMEPFFTNKPVSAGTGLGLSLGTEIARQHGGTLTLLDT